MPVPDDLTILSMQEEELVFPRFDFDDAWKLGGILRELAVVRKHAIAIDIRRLGDPPQPLFFTALPGTTPDNARWILRKSNTVARFHRCSYGVGLYLKHSGTTLAEKHALPDADYATHGGSFPIRVVGAGVIGAVTVSGLPQREDHNLVVEALCMILRREHNALKLPTVQ
jgi:uncharacterized protein (UPF0303 family)